MEDNWILPPKQVKSKQRVTDHGEVFTAEREVNAMLDLVKQETERIESRFLEPACGTGNFLIEILRRKLAVVAERYSKSPHEFEKYSILALTSIYGVELLQDNVTECKQRLFQVWEQNYLTHCSSIATQATREAAQYILERNILCGDALTLKNSEGKPIIFSEWSLVTGDLIKRRDFRLDEMLEGHKQEVTLFMHDWDYDEEIHAYIPKPIKEFPPIEYWGVKEHGR